MQEEVKTGIVFSIESGRILLPTCDTCRSVSKLPSTACVALLSNQCHNCGNLTWKNARWWEKAYGLRAKLVVCSHAGKMLLIWEDRDLNSRSSLFPFWTEEMHLFTAQLKDEIAASCCLGWSVDSAEAPWKNASSDGHFDAYTLCAIDAAKDTALEMLESCIRTTLQGKLISSTTTLVSRSRSRTAYIPVQSLSVESASGETLPLPAAVVRSASAMYREPGALQQRFGSHMQQARQRNYRSSRSLDRSVIEEVEADLVKMMAIETSDVSFDSTPSLSASAPDTRLSQELRPFLDPGFAQQFFSPSFSTEKRLGPALRSTPAFATQSPAQHAASPLLDWSVRKKVNFASHTADADGKENRFPT